MEEGDSSRSASSRPGKVRFCIDRGGTFTDIYAELLDADGNPSEERTLKLLSVDPSNYGDACVEGIRRILEDVTGAELPRNKPVDSSRIDSVRMGTTVATNNLLERKGERCALVITKGFRDLLEIGNQSRPNIFDLQARRAGVLYEHAIECDERVCLARNGYGKGQVVAGVAGEDVEVVKPPDLASLESELSSLRHQGISSLAIVLLHSFTFPSHERLVLSLALSLGFAHVSVSSDLMPMVKVVPRGITAVVDAYLTPGIRKYIEGFYQGFDESMREKVPVYFMQSDGGLTPASTFYGFRAVLSGPAGGVVGFARTAFDSQPDDGNKKPVVGFDMGGTSTDVSRYDGAFEHVYETVTAGVTIQAPQLDINTVAAGGGSRLQFRNGVFSVGPESVGAHPGPVCYRKGGLLAVTDANLVLGRLLPQYFPSIFGPNEDQPLDLEASRAAMAQLTDVIHAGRGQSDMSPEEVAYGFLRVANEAMCRPIRELSEARGHDPADHILACFGGAGGQHACAIARALGMKEVFVHRHCGILSAYGMGLADIVAEEQEPCSVTFSPAEVPSLLDRLGQLASRAGGALAKQGHRQASDIKLQRFLNLRYDGTDTSMMITLSEESAHHSPEEVYNECMAGLVERYRREFGFDLKGRSVVVDDIRVRGMGKSPGLKKANIEAAPGTTPEPLMKQSCYFENGWQETPVYHLDNLRAEQKVDGPALIMMKGGAIVLEPGCEATITSEGDVRIVLHERSLDGMTTELDLIQLSIFGHRFMGIAEQMGRMLQRTAISTNIKERLDFSCALFDPNGGLVANAPHVPVHLGAMAETVKWQSNHWRGRLRPGDVLCTNHPSAGGSHLPDITVITPVFRNDASKDDTDAEIVFWVASRAHHADIGGLTPGSMPPFSKTLEEEGAPILALKLVDGGEFQEERITEALLAPGRVKRAEGEPAISGTRRLSDNISDLKAQVAANHKGIGLIQELIASHGLDVVHAYMRHVQANAADAVQAVLRKLSLEQKLPEVGSLEAEDFMDDGSPIRLKLTIDRPKGTCHFDFTGTGPQVLGNWNAPRAVALAAVIYAARCLVASDIPLNQGCMAPITVTIPPFTLLSPSDGMAVVGGNVLTSQRVTDVIFQAFRACACAQGCMNNFTFGDETFGFYETIGGGYGAGPSWHGTSGIQVHMTNTRITDPEILERRYPVLLREFSFRRGSGGRGKYNGGDGLIREVEFRRAMTANILSERRAYRPCGLFGGEAGQAGQNLLIRPRRAVAAKVVTDDTHATGSDTHNPSNDGVQGGGEGEVVTNLGGKNSVRVEPGDRFRIETPGGGGYGKPEGEL